jgi:hypothetical protein
LKGLDSLIITLIIVGSLALIGFIAALIMKINKRLKKNLHKFQDEEEGPSAALLKAK